MAGHSRSTDYRAETHLKEAGDSPSETDLGGANVLRHRFGVGAGGHTDIALLQPERAIGIIVGRFVLEPSGDGGTRLLFRESLQTQGPPAQGPGVLRMVVWDPAHFVMVRRVLEGIKERAEAQPLVPDGLSTLGRLGWGLAGAGLLAAFAAHRRWWPWLLLPVLLLVPPFLATHDLDSALAGFLALGITIAGALRSGRRWWPAYVLIAALVLLVLLLAPDAFAAFGLIFLVAMVAAVIAVAPCMLAAPQGRGWERRAARYSDIFNVFRPGLARLGDIYVRLNERVAMVGRDVRSLRRTATVVPVVYRDPSEMERRTRVIQKVFTPLFALGPMTAAQFFDWLRAHGDLAGTPREVAEQAQRYAELGVDELMLDIFDADDLDHLDLIAQTVSPR